jgi:alanine-synthesizing transaminase
VPHRSNSFASVSNTLCFTLSGLSKVCGLPGHKLGWIVVSGPDAERKEALERLAIITDTYLSVSAPIQHALSELLAGRHAFQHAIGQHIAANRAELARSLSTVRPSEGGWNAVIDLPGGLDGEQVAMGLLQDHNIVVHPGYLFDFEEDDVIVVSLLSPPKRFAEAIAGIGSALPSLCCAAAT